MNRNLILLFFLLALSVNSFSQEKPVSPPPENVVPKKEPDYPGTYEEVAEYPGGHAAMKKYLADSLRLPKSVVEEGIEGKCYVKFVVSEQGVISDVKVIKGVPGCPECDAEAKRLVQAMPDWKPARVNGSPVKSYYTLPIRFQAD